MRCVMVPFVRLCVLSGFIAENTLCNGSVRLCVLLALLQRILCVPFVRLCVLFGFIAENALCNGSVRLCVLFIAENTLCSFRALMRIVWLLQRMLLCLFVLSVFLLFVRSFTDFGGWFLVVLVLRVAF